MTTAELLNKLSKKYPSPRFAFLGEVRNHTGFYSKDGQTRSIDALALGLWPSAGQFLHGFELKISRSDWQHELKQPQKSEAIYKYCDMFSLVISDMSVIDIGEVPRTWGIMVAQNGTVKTVREAPMLKAKPISRDFLCGFLRKFTENINQQFTPTVEVETRIKESVEAQTKYKLEQNGDYEKRFKELEEKVDKFCGLSGINRYDFLYNGSEVKDIGEAVKTVLNGKKGLGKLAYEYVYIQDQAKGLVKKAKESLEALEKIGIVPDRGF